MDLLSFPPRLRPDGTFATVEDGSDDANREAIALLCLTRKGERPLVPDYGITDPVASELDVAELNAALETFGPPLLVTDADVTYPDDRTALVVLNYVSPE